MKPLLVTCIFCASSVLAHAQKFDVSISPETKYERGSPLVKVGNFYLAKDLIGYKEPFFSFKIAKMKFGIKLSMYDSTMKLVKENMLAGGDKAFGPVAPTFQVFDGKPYLAYYRYREAADDGKIELVLAAIDMAALNLADERVCLSIGQGDTKMFRSFRQLDDNRFRTAESPDGSKKLFYWAPWTGNRYFYAVASKDLVFGKTVEGAVPGSTDPGYRSACIDNDGNIYVGYKAEIAKNLDQSRVMVCAASGKIRDMEIKLPEGNAFEVQVLATRDGRAKVCGTYLTGNDYLQGVYLSDIGPGIPVIKPTATPFPEAFIKQLETDGWAKSAKKGIAALSMGALELADGIVDMIGEFRRADLSSNNNFVYISGCVVNVMMQGGNVVFARIPKGRRSAGSTTGDSFSAFPYKDKMIVLYNDHDDNLRKSMGEAPSGSSVYKNDVLVAGTFSLDGTLKREKIIDLQNENYLAVVEWLPVLSPSSFMVPLVKIGGLGAVKAAFRWATVNIR